MQKLFFIQNKHRQGISAREIARQLGASRDMVERQIAKMQTADAFKGHDDWILATLASENHDRIKDLQHQFPQELGCPISMSLEVFDRLHSGTKELFGERQGHSSNS